ncbi:HAL protein kinase [Cladophialophora psammophila CBS 110553]|uniref:HAL protein kinase n=1 Tax=Cladophialophora psammophila CBS 110553 TaxID=1182543 RepID=W9WN80_9EURO|nr:HAL protein kinase [Cladophialophora psammophila CBS 110553]EXJ66465.1 HAL protein kinase [Cladophialophora psammophila CBS 110553]
MNGKFRIALCLVLVLVNVVCYSAAAPAPAQCWLNYSRIHYTTIPHDLESGYGAIVKELGAGTTGSVFLLLRHIDNATVAVKRFHNAAADQDDVFAQRVKLEYHLGTLLNGHSGIAESFELLLETRSSTWFLVTEFCPRSLAKERLSTSLESLTKTFRGILEAVEHMHSRSISHGDLKLENVLLTADGRPKLIDFGAATFSQCPTETPGSANSVNVVPGDYGTTAYMPPDIFTQLEFDKEKADVWALGILFYAMIIGSVPWSAASINDPRYQAYVTPGPLEDSVKSGHCPSSEKSTINFETCSTGAFHMLQKLPSDSRDMIASMLVPEPLDRPSLQTLLSSIPQTRRFWPVLSNCEIEVSELRKQTFG